MGREVMDHRAKPFMGLNQALTTLQTSAHPLAKGRGASIQHPAPEGERRAKIFLPASCSLPFCCLALHRAVCQVTGSAARGLTLCRDSAADESVWCWGLRIGADARQGLAASRKQSGGLSCTSTALDFVGMTLFPGCCHPYGEISPLGPFAPPYRVFLPFFPCLTCFWPWRWCWLAFWLRVMPTFSAASLHLRAAPCPIPGKESSQGEIS